MTINRDQVQGRSGEVRGMAREVVGGPLGDRAPEAQGTIQKDSGAAKAPVADAEVDFDIVTGKS